MNKFFPYGRQCIYENDTSAISDVLKEPLITRGPKVAEFEEELSRFCGAKYAVAFSSGSSALSGACFAAGASHGDKLFTAANSFVASCGCGKQFGCDINFIDIDEATGNITFDGLDKHLNNLATRSQTLSIPVHFSGNPIDMQAYDRLIKQPNTITIEDACHALGAVYPTGETVGSCAYSQMTVFSFHPLKSITTGEGGAVTTNSQDIAEKLRFFRNSGIEKDPSKIKNESPGPWYYEIQEITGNHQFTDLQAALGLSQLKRLKHFIKIRRKLASYYLEKLQGIEEVIPLSVRNESSSHHLFVVKIAYETLGTTRKEIMEFLFEKGIGTQVHYIPLYSHPFYLKMKNKPIEEMRESFPGMESYYSKALTLPLYVDLKEKEIDYIVESLKEFFAGISVKK